MAAPHVITGKSNLSVHCENCGKSAMYKTGQHLSEWAATLVEFRRNHKDCKPNKTTTKTTTTT